jgi:hypothetical protein
LCSQPFQFFNLTGHRWYSCGRQAAVEGPRQKRRHRGCARSGPIVSARQPLALCSAMRDRAKNHRGLVRISQCGRLVTVRNAMATTSAAARRAGGGGKMGSPPTIVVIIPAPALDASLWTCGSRRPHAAAGSSIAQRHQPAAVRQDDRVEEPCGPRH